MEAVASACTLSECTASWGLKSSKNGGTKARAYFQAYMIVSQVRQMYLSDENQASRLPGNLTPIPLVNACHDPPKTASLRY